jgi:hypothetical protein
VFNNKQNDDSLNGAFRSLYNKILKDIENKLPVEVLEVNANRTKVTVRPLIDKVDKDENRIQRQEIKGIHVFTAGAGNFLMSFPISVGDKGWIDAADRDISIFLQSYSSAPPPTRRMHDFNDSIFYPDIMTGFTIAEEDAGAVVIQNKQSTIKIALDESEARVSNGAVKITITGADISIDAPSGMTINGAKVTPDGDVVTASGVSLNNHYHNQGADSAGDSQDPTDAPTATEI